MKGVKSRGSDKRRWVDTAFEEGAGRNERTPARAVDKKKKGVKNPGERTGISRLLPGGTIVKMNPPRRLTSSNTGE